MGTAIVKCVEFLAHAAFPAVVFAISSDITRKDILAEIKHPVQLLRITFVTVLVVPVVTAVIFKLFHADIVVTGIALIAAIAPGDSFALLEAESKRARIALAAVIMVWLCLLMPLTVPLWLGVVSKFFPLCLEASPLDIFRTVAPLTIIPLVLAVLCREFFPGLSSVLKKVAGIFFKLAIVIVALASFLYVPKGIAHFTVTSIAALFLAVTAALFMGYYCGLPERKDRLTSALTASLGNFALVILVAHVSYPKAHILAESVVFILIRWFVIMFWYLLLLRVLKRKGEAL